MSTDLYGVRVLAMAPAERKVTFRVLVVYYDTADKSHLPLPQDPSFFLRILFDAVPYGKSLPGIELRQILDETWVNDNTYRFISQVRQLSTRNFPLTDYTGYFDFYVGDSHWRDEEKLVQADYEVFYRDAHCLRYLKPGQSWGTTSYETTSAQLTQTAAPGLPRLTAEPVRLEPFAGERGAGTPDDFVFSADGRQLVIQSEEGELAAFDTGTWREVWRTPQAPGCFTYLDGSRATGIMWLQDFQAHDATTGPVAAHHQASGELADQPPAVATARLASPGRTHFVDYGYDDQFHFLNEQGEESWRIEQPAEVEVVSFSPDEQLVALGCLYPQVTVWDLATRTEVQTIDTPDCATGLALDPSNTYLAVCFSKELEIYDLGRGERVLRYTSPHDYLSTVAWSPGGSCFALKYVGGDYSSAGYVRIFPGGNPAGTAPA